MSWSTGLIALTVAAFGGRGAMGRRGWLVFEGITGIIIGVLTFAWPDITALVLLWFIAAWALVTGAPEIVAAIRLRREIEGEWLLGLGGALSVLFGILLAIWPATGALALVIIIGAYAIVFGVVLVGLALRLRRLQRETGAVHHRPAPA